MAQRSLGNFNCQSETPRFHVSNVIFAMNGAYKYYKYIKTHVLRCTTIGFKQKYGHRSSRRADMNMNLRCKSVFFTRRKQVSIELLRRRSQTMRSCYLTPFLFKYLHKTPYYREILNRNIELEMYFYCWWVLSDCAIRETADQRRKLYEKQSLPLIFTFYLNRGTSVLELFPVVVFQ